LQQLGSESIEAPSQRDWITAEESKLQKKSEQKKKRNQKKISKPNSDTPKSLFRP